MRLLEHIFEATLRGVSVDSQHQAQEARPGVVQPAPRGRLLARLLVLAAVAVVFAIPQVRDGEFLHGFVGLTDPRGVTFFSPLWSFLALETVIAALAATIVAAALARIRPSVARDTIGSLAALAFGYALVVATCFELAYAASIVEGESAREALANLDTLRAQLLLDMRAERPGMTFAILFFVLAVPAMPLAFVSLSRRSLTVQVVVTGLGALALAAPGHLYFRSLAIPEGGNPLYYWTVLTARATAHAFWALALGAAAVPLLLRGADVVADRAAHRLAEPTSA